ncbi:hypothetical protein A45J_0390 [hot springs metagenome]|uniref:Uncharacterized protein n=1 Tax=hot springs metagenome TaxID=433727 RepID=A0A5J4L039_9ZZZZ
MLSLIQSLLEKKMTAVAKGGVALRLPCGVRCRKAFTIALVVFVFIK